MNIKSVTEMSQNQYIFHTQTQVLRSKEVKRPETQKPHFRSERERTRFSNDHYKYRHENKNEPKHL